MDFYHLFGYLSGLLFIKPDMDAVTLLRTGAMVHVLDATLCLVVASQSGRSKVLWTLAGLVFGIWALAAIFLLPAKVQTKMIEDRE
ncbi:MAG: hypothetical protein FJ143_10130 [Deltaproteobacteria bacterium]|nr:hypothetical protein [Deltaproteobacteria bacterium]MBM4298085.1 hypothetical protein [Deltaproteobacteria bacterium]